MPFSLSLLVRGGCSLVARVLRSLSKERAGRRKRGYSAIGPATVALAAHDLRNATILRIFGG